MTMATTKIWAVKNNTGRVLNYANDPSKTRGTEPKELEHSQDGLSAVLQYAKNADKTEHEYYTEGLNCDPSSALSDFNRVKERFRKTDGILAYHAYMSFAPGECTPDEAMQIGVEFAKKQWGDDFQVVISEHLNTDCLHCHFVINSVAFTDGHKLQDNEKNWNKFRFLADDICKAHGKSIVEVPGEARKRPTKREIQIKNLLDKGIAATDSPEELKVYLEKRGCNCDFEHKHWTVTPNGWTKPYRIEKLGQKFEGAPDYSKEGIIAQYRTPMLKVLPKPQRKSNRTFSSRADLIIRDVNPYYAMLSILLMLIHKRWLRYLVPIERYKYSYRTVSEADVKAFKEIEDFKHDYAFIKQHNLKTEGDAEALKADLLKEKSEVDSALALIQNRKRYEGNTQALLLEEQRYEKRKEEIRNALAALKRIQSKKPDTDSGNKTRDDRERS